MSRNEIDRMTSDELDAEIMRLFAMLTPAKQKIVSKMAQRLADENKRRRRGLIAPGTGPA
jgi:hypothetical protein